MARGNRIHRLPQRLDYALIPAPLDLSLTDVSEKAALPSIIVTPSSPTSTPASGYFLAFLPPPAPPPLRARVAARVRGWLPAGAAPEQAVKLPATPAEERAQLLEEKDAPAAQAQADAAPAPCVPGMRFLRARTLVLLLLLLFILACHLLTHRLAARRPALDFVGAGPGAPSDAVPALAAADGDAGAWWDVAWLWDAPQAHHHAAAEGKRDFVVEAFPGMNVHGV